MWKDVQKGNFARHRKVHTDSNSVFTCQICAKTFSRTDNLHAHVTKCHEENLELYKCVVTIITMFPSNVSSIGLPEKMQSRNGCTYLTFLFCVFLNVSSNCLHEHMHSYIGCIISLFSTVRFQMCPQIACTRGCKVTLIALFFTVCY